MIYQSNTCDTVSGYIRAAGTTSLSGITRTAERIEGKSQISYSIAIYDSIEHGHWIWSYIVIHMPILSKECMIIRIVNLDCVSAALHYILTHILHVLDSLRIYL